MIPTRLYPSLLLAILACPHAIGQAASTKATAADAGHASDPSPGNGSPGEDTQPSFERSDESGDVHVSFSPFAWATGFSGTAGSNRVAVKVDNSFADILDKADTVFGLMGALDVEYKGFVFQFNATWVNSEITGQTGVFRDGTVNADLEVTGAWIECLAGYRLIDEPLGSSPDSTQESPHRVKFDAFVGGRLTSIDLDLSMTATGNVTLPDGEVLQPGRETQRERSEQWIEPFVGARGILNLDRHWLILVRGDVGGFGVDGSDFSWQAVALAGYEWQLDGWNFALLGGYRALGQDYSSDGFEWDMVTHGPLLAATVSMKF